MLREIDLTEAELRHMLSKPNFFGKLHPYLSTLLGGNPVGAFNEGLAFLDEIRKCDDAAYRSQHKGNPFYWLGIAAFLAHDYETAVFFFDGAVSEDIRAGSDPRNSKTPALKFAYVKGKTKQHAAKPLVRALQATIERELAAYNARAGRAGTLSNLKPQGGTLGKVLQELNSELGITRKIDIRSPSFAKILAATKPNQSLTDAMERTGKVRNTLGHSLGWPASLDDVKYNKYNLLASDIAASCLHVINSLYR